VSACIHLGAGFGLRIEECGEGAALVNDLGKTVYLDGEALEAITEWWTKPAPVSALAAAAPKLLNTVNDLLALGEVDELATTSVVWREVAKDARALVARLAQPEWVP
jgi:hypothetical protein